jgi:hypothetical protein
MPSSVRGPAGQSADLGSVDDDVAQVRAERRIERSAAGDEAQFRVGRRAVHLLCRETLLKVQPCLGEQRLNVS